MNSRYTRALTPREQEVIELLSTGLTNEEIARQLDISLDGVKYHVSGILRRLRVENRREAASLHLGTEGGVLTPRELEVIELLSAGLTNEEIARQLGISLDGVKYHVSGILRRLDVGSRREAASLHLRAEGSGRFAAWAPVMFLRKLPFAWLPKAAAGAVLTATAAGIARLAWGVLSTSSDGVKTADCSAAQSAANSTPCAPIVAPAAAGAVAASAGAISAGGSGTCAVKDGGVWCWGAAANGYFGRGKGTTTDSGAPVAMAGLASGVSAVAGAGGSGCAIKDGGVWCWTTYSRDDLGGSGLACRTQYPGCSGSSLFAVPNLASGVTALSGGCAIKDGGAWCAGSDQNPGGNPESIDQASADATAAACQFGACDIPVFVAVPGLDSGVNAISGGNSLSCAVKDDGAWCWGSNWAGQLGNDSTTDSPVAVAVFGLGGGVSAISAGDTHVCALKDGGVWCWGWNGEGQLGDGSTAQSHVPVAVSGQAGGVSAISAGPAHNCALKGGGVWCWGQNRNGQIGDNRTTDSPVPVQVPGLASGATAISAGGDHSCAVTDAGAWCWGGNAASQLGNNRPKGSDVPVAVSGLASGVSAIEGTCALKGGGVWCWGANDHGQLGNNSTADSAVPVAVSGLGGGASAIRPGPCALKDGAFWCWGAIATGEAVNSTTDSAVPVAVSELVAGVAPGTGGLCALKGGGVWCWGGSPAPVLERGLESGVSALSGCALKDGGVWCWSFGGNPNGGLNDVPVAVPGLESGVNAISPGCALKSGGVWCWGFGDQTGAATSPVLLSGLGSGVSAISGSCALKEGGVWCWGPNGFDTNGQYQVTVPVAMPRLASGVSAITPFGDGGCALKDGGVWCWGDNTNGQLGNDSPPDSRVPVAVQFPP